ncbi:MAG: hypothetical protein M1828_001268 [Chrysothrix sp. TS-e1954]|nr:MAG: hypothetical protein M1828_001268 [Chrysothrix sp. TS-e1954]
MSSNGYETYKLGDFPLQSGGILKDAYIAYKTFGDVTKNPAVIYPTWFSGSIEDNVWLIGDDMTLSAKTYFIVIPALFGNGESTSPSNTPSPRPFPNITFYDNVKAQHKLVTEHLGIKHANAVLGWSMGGVCTYQWATQYPDFMDYIVPFCGCAKTSLHCQVFGEGVKSALLGAKGAVSAGVKANEATPNDQYKGWNKEERERALKAMARVYAGWGFSQAFYREKLYESAPALGFKDLDDFLVTFWEGWGLSKDPENLITMMWTWQAGDVSAQEPYNGDFKKAMQGIKAKALVLPSQTDLYFPPEDSAIEVANMRPGIGHMVPFPSIWGHWAGGPGQSIEDVKWLDSKLRWFLS